MCANETDRLAVAATSLRKTYAGGIEALKGIDLQLDYGQVLALLGPNGSGKTTTVNILATITRPDGGDVVVAGADLRTNPAGVRERIGVAGQFVSVDNMLTGRENLMLVGRLNHLRKADCTDRVEQLVAQFDLADFADRRAASYSGGMRRRLDLAAAIIAQPRVLMIDEPTTGLDPRSRLQVWDTVTRLVTSGAAVLLTTQYLEEADKLADNVLILDYGRVVAEGTPTELKKLVGGTVIEVTFPDEQSAQSGSLVMSGRDHVIKGAVVRISGLEDAEAALPTVISELTEANLPLTAVQLRFPTLDDVFLELTGKPEGADAGEIPSRLGH
jgi:ABC-2 type transport system ATP-binding protein